MLVFCNILLLELSCYVKDTRMVSELGTELDAFDIQESKAGNERYCLQKIDKMTQEMEAGTLKGIDFKRNLDNLLAAFLAIRGIPLSQASKDCMNPIDRLENTDILEMGEKALDQLSTAIKGIVAMNLQKKNRWLKLIEGVKAIQVEARKSTINFWVYVGRTSEKNEIFKMAPVQQGFFDIWEDDDCNSLIEAPPGHTKTTSLRGKVLHTVCEHPDRRILILYDTDDKAKKEVNLLKTYIGSGRLQALYPDIYALDRNDGSENSSKRFTVNRPNIGSREPTIECAGILSRINGNGYDEIIIDDPCPETVANQPAERQKINTKFDTVVEQRLRDPKNSRIKVICTPWHLEDLAGHIIKDQNEGKRTGWRIETKRFAIKLDENGKHIPIWPERYDSEYYADQQRRLTRNDYARLYEMKCIADEERLVKNLHYYPALGEADPLWHTLPKARQTQYLEKLEAIKKGEIWLSIDPSATSGKSSSNTAITKFSLTSTGEAYVVAAWEKPGNPVETQDWIVDQIMTGKIDFVLIEAQGGMVGTVILWTDYILRKLREIGYKWNGSIVRCRTQGKGGGQNIGKTIRLKNVASFLQKGYLKFPGALRFIPHIGKFYFVRGSEDSIIRLTQQILDFPAGTDDGVDTVSQWLIRVSSRLPAMSEFDYEETETASVYTDPMVDMHRQQMHALLHPPKNSDPTGEHKWNTQLLGV